MDDFKQKHNDKRGVPYCLCDDCIDIYNDEFNQRWAVLDKPSIILKKDKLSG